MLAKEIDMKIYHLNNILKMIRPYLRYLIHKHKPIEELNNNNNNNDNNNDTDRGKWKIQLTMQNNCISTKRFEEGRTIHTWSKPVEIFICSDTENVADTRKMSLLEVVNNFRIKL